MVPEKPAFLINVIIIDIDNAVVPKGFKSRRKRLASPQLLLSLRDEESSLDDAVVIQ